MTTGTLYIVATPIGNMEDITERASRILKSASLILVEDTRVSAKLMTRLCINAKMESYHKFSEKGRLDRYIEMLEEGRNIAMISDAGTPCVSDPGKYLVREALERGITVCPVPGASAVAASFSASGVLADSFVFAGFLPHKGAEREHALEKFLEPGLPVVFYESPNRIISLLASLGERKMRVVVCREITKHFEEIFVYKDQEIKELGEFTVVAEPCTEIEIRTPEETIEKELLEKLLSSGLSSKDTADILKRCYPALKPNNIKDYLLSLKRK